MPLLWACRISAEKSVDNVMRILWYFICCFSVVALNMFGLFVFNFFHLITLFLSIFPLGFILYWTLFFLDLDDSFLSRVRDVFSYYLFKYFLRLLSLSLLLLWPLKSKYGCICPRGLKMSSLNYFFFIIFSVTVTSTILSFSSLIHSSASFILLLIPSIVFFI